MKKTASFLFVLSLFFISSCKKDPKVLTEEDALIPSAEFKQPEIISQNIVVDPTGYAPLTAVIKLSTSVATRATIRVIGKHGSASDVIKRFDTLSTSHTLPVLGLYAGHKNIVELTLFNGNNISLGSSRVYMQTGPLSPALPEITIDASLPGKKAGMTLVSYLAYAGTTEPKQPFMFDEFGDIRWYLDYTAHAALKNLNYDNGVERLKNGNLYFGDLSSSAIYEVNMLGGIVNTWPFPGYTFHHKVLEKPNGNFLVTVNKDGLTTIEDHIIEIDRNSKQIVNVWDFRKSLQQGRNTLILDLIDWLHINSVEYDAADNTIIVSGRTQGVVKVDAANQVKWILGPHLGWGNSGNGVDLRTKLLQPLDANNAPITETLVLNGNANHPDFEWNWYQHAPKRMPNGNLSLFDNGDNRNYTGTGPYSRAVEYRIDEAAMTVQQVWAYGKNRGSETYSRIISDVDYHEDVDHFIFSPGAISNNGFYGKIVEVDRSSQQVLFEATIRAPALYSKLTTFHRSERMSLYP